MPTPRKDSPTAAGPARRGILTPTRDTNARRKPEATPLTAIKEERRRDAIFSKNWRVRSQSEEPLLGDTPSCDVSSCSTCDSRYPAQPARDTREISSRRTFGGSYDNESWDAAESISSDGEFLPPTSAEEVGEGTFTVDGHEPQLSALPVPPPTRSSTPHNAHESTMPALSGEPDDEDFRPGIHDGSSAKVLNHGLDGFLHAPLRSRLPSDSRDSAVSPFPTRQDDDDALSSPQSWGPGKDQDCGPFDLPHFPLGFRLPLIASRDHETADRRPEENTEDASESDIHTQGPIDFINFPACPLLPLYAKPGTEIVTEDNEDETFCPFHYSSGIPNMDFAARLPPYAYAGVEFDEEQGASEDWVFVDGPLDDIFFPVNTRLPLHTIPWSEETTPSMDTKDYAGGWFSFDQVLNSRLSLPLRFASAVTETPNVTHKRTAQNVALEIAKATEDCPAAGALCSIQEVARPDAPSRLFLSITPLTETELEHVAASGSHKDVVLGELHSLPESSAREAKSQADSGSTGTENSPLQTRAAQREPSTQKPPSNADAVELTEDRRRFDALVSRLQKKLSQDRESEESRAAALPAQTASQDKETVASASTTTAGKSRGEPAAGGLNPKASQFVSLSAHGSQNSSIYGVAPASSRPSWPSQEKMQPDAPRTGEAPQVAPSAPIAYGSTQAPTGQPSHPATLVQANVPLSSESMPKGVVCGSMAKLGQYAPGGVAYPSSLFGHQENRPVALPTRQQPPDWESSGSGYAMPIHCGASEFSETMPPSMGPRIPGRRGMKPRGRIPFDTTLSTDEQQQLEQHLEQLRSSVPYFALLSKKRQKARWEAQQARLRQRQRQSQAWQQMEPRATYVPPPGMHPGGHYAQTSYGRPVVPHASMASFMPPPAPFHPTPAPAPAPAPVPAMAPAQMGMAGGLDWRTMPYGYTQGQVPGAYMTL